MEKRVRDAVKRIPAVDHQHDRAHLTRRDLVRCVGGAGGAFVAVATGSRLGIDGFARAGNQLDATPPVVPKPGATQAYGPTVATKAAELDYDVDKIFRFVADDVRYEPYAGALRGADGTLWGLAGNATDKSLLLAALLDESQITWRFATSILTPDESIRLAAAVPVAAADITSSFNQTLLAAYTPTVPDAAATPYAATPSSAEEDRLAQMLVESSRRANDLASARSAAMEEIISSALKAANIRLDPNDPNDPKQGVSDSAPSQGQHVWVQIADGPTWHDLDSSLPGTKRNEPISKAPSMSAEIPADSYHQVTIRIIAEEVSGGSPVRRDVVTYATTSAGIGQSPLTLGLAPPSSMASLGATIIQITTGQVSYYPYVGVAGKVVSLATTPVTFGSGGDALTSVLDAATPTGLVGEGDLLGLWYAVDVVSPGADAITIEREIFDRIGFVNRELGKIDLAQVAPVNLITAEDNTQIVPDLAKAIVLAIGTGDIPATYTSGSGQDPFFGLSSMGAAHVAFAASLMRAQMLATGVHAFIGRPQLIAFTLASEHASDAESPILLNADLLLQTRAFLPTAGTAPKTEDLHPAVRAGILSQVAESVLLDPIYWGSLVSEQMTGGVTVGGLFEAASKAGMKALVLADALATIPDSFSPEAAVRIGRALKAGTVVIVPEQPVAIGDVRMTGWWAIDRLTGHTSDMLENGLGYASVILPGGANMRAQIAEDVEITKEVTSWMPWWRRVGGCVGAVSLLAAATIDPTSINEGTFTTGLGAAKLALRVYSRSPGILKDIAGCL